MATTYSFVVDSVGSPEAIITQSVCRRLRLRQNDQSVAALLPFNYRAPLATSPAIRYEGGEELVIEGNPSFQQVTVTVGYIETLSSSAAFSQIEE